MRVSLIGTLILILAMGIGRFAYTPLLPMMQADGLLDLQGSGVIAAVHFLGYLLGAMSVASVRLPTRSLLKASLLITALSTALMGLSDSFFLWMLLRFINGLLSAWALVMVSSHYIGWIGRHTDPRAPPALAAQSRIFSGVGLGIALTGLLCLGFMAANLSSQSSWLLLGGVSLCLCAVLWFLIGSEVPNSAPDTAKRGASNTRYDVRALVAYGAMGIGYIIPATYLPVMARQVMDDPLVFGWSWPIFGAAAMLSTLLVPALSTRQTPRQLWQRCQWVMAVGLIVPVLGSGMINIVIAGLCVGGTFMIITLAGMKEAHRIAGQSSALGHVAAMTSCFAAGQMAGPLLATWLHHITQSFAPALLLTSLMLIITAVLLREHHPDGNAVS